MAGFGRKKKKTDTHAGVRELGMLRGGRWVGEGGGGGGFGRWARWPGELLVREEGREVGTWWVGIAGVCRFFFWDGKPMYGCEVMGVSERRLMVLTAAIRAVVQSRTSCILC